MKEAPHRSANAQLTRVYFGTLVIGFALFFGCAEAKSAADGTKRDVEDVADDTNEVKDDAELPDATTALPAPPTVGVGTVSGGAVRTSPRFKLNLSVGANGSAAARSGGRYKIKLGVGAPQIPPAP